MTNHPGNQQFAMSDAVPAEPHSMTSWPTVIGVIGIVLAALTILGSICVFAFASNLLAGLISEEQQANMPPTLFSTESVVSSIIGFIIALWLLFGSIGLIQRRGSSRGILNGWAIVAIIWTLISTTWVLIDLNQASEQTNEAVADDPSMSESERQQQKIMESVNRITAQTSPICGGIFQLAWPIIVLCFINGSRRKQEMAAWSNVGDQQKFSI